MEKNCDVLKLYDDENIERIHARWSRRLNTEDLIYVIFATT